MFHGTAALKECQTAPADLNIKFYLNDSVLPGAHAHHTFTDNNEEVMLVCDAPFKVVSTPDVLSVVVEDDCASFSDISLTVIRLGSLPSK